MQARIHNLVRGWLAGSAFAFLCVADAAAESHQAVNASFLYPVSTNRDPDISTNFRLNLLDGRVGSLRGVDLSGVVSRTGGDVRGFQAAGVHAWVGGQARGILLTGAVGYVASDVRGIQVAGAVNFDRGRFVGAQYATLFNYVEGELSGIQLSGVYNLANGDARYVQIASVINATAGSFRGLQLSGGINYTFHDIDGFQIGLGNVSTRVGGGQVGIANVARKVDGVQIGILNLAREVDGVAVGAINWAENGTRDWVAFGSNLMAFNLGLRTAVNGFYSMLTAGIGDVEDSRGDTASLSWHYGYAIPVADKWSVDVDLGYVHIMAQPSDEVDKKSNLYWAGQARVMVERQLGNSFSVFGGGGASLLFSEYASDASTETKGHFAGGISWKP